MISRRSLIAGLGLFVAAPAIVRASSIMKVRPEPLPFRVGIADEYDTVRWVSLDLGDADFTACYVIDTSSGGVNPVRWEITKRAMQDARDGRVEIIGSVDALCSAL